jgi:hypothetical protein
MSRQSKNLSPAQLAMQMRAQRTKRLLLINLGLLGVLACVALVLLGVKNGWFAKTPEGTADSGYPAAPVTIDPVSPSAPVEPTKYPVRKFAVICDVSGHAQPGLSKFLPNAMSQFNEKQLVDVMTLTSDGAFISATNGMAPMPMSAKKKACDFIAGASADSGTSVKGAIQKAVDEKAEAIYLLTTPMHAKEFGADPMATLGQWTGGQKMAINCIVFRDDTDSDADVAVFKSISKGTNGECMVEASKPR